MKIGKRIIGTIVFPVIAFAIAIVLSLIKGVTLFDSAQTSLVFVRAIVTTTIVTFALSINLNSGRFDFSLGAISLLSSVVGLKIALATGLPAVPTILLSILIGALLGAVSGGIYVLTNLPPIIVSLGITLLYEGIAYTITGGHGISIVTQENLMKFPTILSLLVIGVIVFALIIVVFDYTKFGYEYNALITGQKTSVNTGIKEVLNAVICYAISGGLMGLYGFLSTTTNGVVNMSLNFGSISPMFSAFFPMFVGGFVGHYSNNKLGYLMGGLVSAIISIMFIRFNVESSVQQIITAVILVVFLIYLNNQGIIKKIIASFKFKKEETKNN